MPEDNREFTHESLQDRESIVKYFSALGEGLGRGKLLLICNGEQLTLEPGLMMKFEISAKQKRNRSQVVLKMSWKHDRNERVLKVEPLEIEPRGG